MYDEVQKLCNTTKSRTNPPHLENVGIIIQLINNLGQYKHFCIHLQKCEKIYVNSKVLNLIHFMFTSI